jgi:DNA repair exonuclease SbcCD ATPase subunit
MRKITYKKLSIQNFLSIGNDVVEINYQNGLNLITGINRDFPDRKNAIGKTSIANAHFFAIYGDALKKLKRDFIVNNVTKGKGMVELEFDVETEKSKDTYIVKRQVKPSKVELWKNGEDITLDSIANNKDFIADLVGTNADACKKCDILTMNDKNNPPFMAMKPEDKRKFINDIFSLEVFGRMMKDLKSIITDNNKEMSISSTKIDEITNTLETLKNQQEIYRKKQEEREAIFKVRRESIENDIKSVEDDIKSFEKIPDISEIEANLKKYEDGYDKITDKQSSLTSKLSEKRTLKKVKEAELVKVQSVGGATCDKCLQEIPHDHIALLTYRISDLEDHICNFDDEIKDIQEENKILQGKKDKISNKIAEFKSEIKRVEKLQRELQSLKDLLVRNQKELKTLLEDFKQEETPIFDTNVTETEERKKTEVEKYAKLKEYSDDLETCKFMLGEEGVKSFVVKRLLSMLNASIQQYINDLGLSIRCKFDEYFDEQMTNDKGKEICYWNLSGAEGRTIDLACAWAFKDIKRKISGVSSNLEILDEVMDSGFDEVGMDKLINVLKRRIDKYDMSVYAISHRSETNKHLSGELVMLEMDGGITRRI